MLIIFFLVKSELLLVLQFIVSREAIQPPPFLTPLQPARTVHHDIVTLVWSTTFNILITTILIIIIITPYCLIIMAPHPISPISCLRCTSFGIQCCIVDVPSPSPYPKHLCNQCYAAGMDQCIFLPSIRLIDNTPSNSKCISCSAVKSKCIFTNANDGQCVRCSKLCIPCCMKLKGKCMR